MELDCIILYSLSYSVVDDVTSALNQGVSFSYLLTDNLLPFSGTSGSFGYKPCKGSLPISFVEKLESVPGLYKFYFGLTTGSNGKPQMNVLDFNFISDLNLSKS